MTGLPFAVPDVGPVADDDGSSSVGVGVETAVPAPEHCLAFAVALALVSTARVSLGRALRRNGDGEYVEYRLKFHPPGRCRENARPTRMRRSTSSMVAPWSRWPHWVQWSSNPPASVPRRVTTMSHQNPGGCIPRFASSGLLRRQPGRSLGPVHPLPGRRGRREAGPARLGLVRCCVPTWAWRNPS